MDWREYEAEIFERLREQFPDTELELDARLPGRISGVERQIDILARGNLMGTRPFAVVDCKHFSRPVDVTVVEAFLGLLADVGAHVGVLITNIGYSLAAQQRAAQDQTRDVQLHVVKVSEIRSIPKYHAVYFGSTGIRVAIPAGWDIYAGMERFPGMASWDVLPKSLSRDAAYRLPLWACLTLLPVAPGQGADVARHILGRRHMEAGKRGNVEYRSEDWGIGDITYSRVKFHDGNAEITATLVAGHVVATVDLQTRQECLANDEQFVVGIARSMHPIELEMPDGEVPSAAAWEAAISRAKDQDPLDKGSGEG